MSDPGIPEEGREEPCPHLGRERSRLRAQLQQRMELLAEGAARRPVGPEQSGEGRPGDEV